MDYYSFNRPRRDGWLSWPCWLTGSGCFTHKVVTRPAVNLAQDMESSPARTGGLSTMLCHQPMMVPRVPSQLTYPTELFMTEIKRTPCHQCLRCWRQWWIWILVVVNLVNLSGHRAKLTMSTVSEFPQSDLQMICEIILKTNIPLSLHIDNYNIQSRPSRD